MIKNNRNTKKINGKRLWLIGIAALNHDLMRVMIYMFHYGLIDGINGDDDVLYADLENVVVVRNNTPVIIRTSEYSKFKRSK